MIFDEPQTSTDGAWPRIVIGVFHDACALLGEIALAASAPPEALADAALEALSDNGYG